ncbi:MAG: amidohydrolase family protein [Defluviitaleaceae bacterium]|nr:amidohydrolase family protein [Defluviitaleaceae bacterium]MCL2837443.1 amidohydrolase family protein [Defluviitaleaceae bacterium]
MLKDRLLLCDYNPVSMLSVPETEVLTPKFPVFDAHIHIGDLQMGARVSRPLHIGEIVRNLKESGIFGVINLKMFWGEPLKRHLELLRGHEDFIHTFASVDVTRLEEPGFAAYADDMLRQFKTMGIRGLKFWKNIGCSLKDSGGAYIRADDKRLFPIWEAAAKYGLIVLIHIADPKSFFTPADEKNEFYESLRENPDWSFYGEGRYTFEELMEQQDNLLSQNPDTTFVIAHVGSCAEDLAWVAR